MTNALREYWTQAGSLAEDTASARNRYVDFLRAGSILVVVFGHWLMAAPYIDGGELVAVNLLRAEPWTHWLTWAFQVMPIFFMVGGYANAASWGSSGRAEYGVWLANRLRRLVLPAVPLVVIWSALAIVTRLGGIDGSLLRVGSQSALIPLWFLAVYVVVVALTPLSHRLWSRYGWASVWAIALAAMSVDLVRWQLGELVGWANFVLVWAAVHQLGYAWHDGRFARRRRPAIAATGGLVLLVGLVAFGPYPVAMVGVPGADITNNSPPTVALIALGVFQTGVLLSVEPIMRRWLQRVGVWSATVALNGMIMSVYLWHLTVMVLVVGASLIIGGLGLGAIPASPEWWTTRPLWITLLTALSIPVIGAVLRFERPAPGAGRFPPLAAVAAALFACVGFAMIAGNGIGDATLWLQPAGVVPVLASAVLLSSHRRRRETREPRPV